MPMIDIYAATDTFADPHQLAVDAATIVMTAEGVPDIPLYRKNTAAFIHEIPEEAIANADGDSDYVRIQVLTNAGSLTRTEQIDIVERLTSLVVIASNNPSLKDRTWVLLTETTSGGWGLRGHALSNEQLINAAREEVEGLKNT